ncbi:hypothetical protein NA57DRAFT_50966 [Rhizodiscina lignyota]|uniref:Uncharacterized protein n=1 Tax=Rhizodiscina lignyota TaxID=1504668 RepID=A0A9P4IQV8_9PEZI|nr:hypothetical protein NA57DRAFT_50966 [Rhizodiscina lignyota]
MSNTTAEKGTVTKTAAQPECTWISHCLGDHCGDDNDCDQDWECKTAVCVQACTWPGHCLGNKCQNFNDCDQDWVCTNNVCAVCTGCGDNGDDTSSSTTQATSLPTSTSHTVQSVSSVTSATSTPSATASGHSGLSTSAAIGIGVAVPLCIIAVALTGFLIWRRRRKRRGESEHTSRSYGHGKQGLDSMNRSEMKEVPVELGADHVAAELEERNVGKHAFHAPALMDVEPVEIDGQEQQRTHTSDLVDQRTLYGTPEVADLRPFHSMGRSEQNMLQTLGSGVSSPSWHSHSPGPPTGYDISSASETDLSRVHRSDGLKMESEGGRRKKLQRKRGFDENF